MNDETATDPWVAQAEPEPAAADADPWSTQTPTDAEGSGADAWLSPGGGADADLLQLDPSAADGGLAWHRLWDGTLPVQDWINQGLDWVVFQFRPMFQAIRAPVDMVLRGIEAALQYPPTLVMVVMISLLAWQMAGLGVGVMALLSLLAIGVLGVWPETMVTLSLVLTSLVFCVLLGLPLGIWLGRSDRAERTMRPILDAMQTTPAFVYLVPVVMLFGIGNVPGVIVTVVFALPPLVRLTSLGLRQVRADLLEAAESFGASPWQQLRTVQLPMALPSIMAGVNQSLMLSLSMVVIASMIAVGGLGLMVLRGIGRLDVGLATVGGLGIVILAILLDRATQALGKRKEHHGQRWYMRGPVGIAWRLGGGRRVAQKAV